MDACNYSTFNEILTARADCFSCSSILSAPRVGSGCCFVCNSLIFARVRTFSPSSTEEQEIQEDQKENKKTDSVCVCLDVAYLSC